MRNAVGAAQTVVVVPGLIAVGIGQAGQTNVFVPLQTRVKAAIVRPLMHRLFN
jgi:hypothetical protein